MIDRRPLVSIENRDKPAQCASSPPTFDRSMFDVGNFSSFNDNLRAHYFDDDIPGVLASSALPTLPTSSEYDASIITALDLISSEFGANVTDNCSETAAEIGQTEDIDLNDDFIDDDAFRWLLNDENNDDNKTDILGLLDDDEVGFKEYDKQSSVASCSNIVEIGSLLNSSEAVEDVELFLSSTSTGENLLRSINFNY